jgi:hypothetical protein
VGSLSLRHPAARGTSRTSVLLAVQQVPPVELVVTWCARSAGPVALSAGSVSGSRSSRWMTEGQGHHGRFPAPLVFGWCPPEALSARRLEGRLSHVNVSELVEELRLHGVPEDAYSINRDRDESYCLTEAYGTWSTYYSERGLRQRERTHSSEDAACRDLLNRLRREFRGF